MKVLEAGRPPVFLRAGMRFTCRTCECIFALETGDEQFGSGFRILTGSRPFPLHCPRCESFVVMATIATADKT